MEIKTRLSPIILYLLIPVSLKLRLSRKTSIINVIKKVFKSLESIPLRLPKKIKIKTRPRILVISITIFTNRKAAMLTNVLKRQKTSDGLGNSMSMTEKTEENWNRYLVFDISSLSKIRLRAYWIQKAKST